MAHSLARPCTYPLCPHLKPCPKHESLALRYRDKYRKSASARGYDSTWNELRQVVMHEEPLCRRCSEQGRVTLTQMVDHIIPVRVRPDLRLDRNNLQGLCYQCHSIKTTEDVARYPLHYKRKQSQ